jgi:hypothetical protein
LLALNHVRFDNVTLLTFLAPTSVDNGDSGLVVYKAA